MLGRTDSRTRALLLLVAFVVVAGSLGVRLAYWQVARRDELAAKRASEAEARARRETADEGQDDA
jgi:cell division protein FtsI/penicillin-binding protein 2